MARGKFVSASRFGSQAGARETSTRPGKPSPLEKTRRLVSDSNPSQARSAEPQVEWQKSFPFLFKTQSAAKSQRPLRAIVLRIFVPISISGACPEIKVAMAYCADGRAW